MPFLNFKGKTAVETYHHALPHHTLEFAPDLSVLGLGREPSLDGNLIIEGDNLLALKALLPTHAGRVKCAYLDPPYNTGNEGWVYNDNLTQPQFREWIGQVVGKEAEDACRHDKWCCMMYPRLMLVRELLREDGAVFISIDDNEVANLRLIMDEVFGQNNFVATIIWEKVYSPKSSARHLSENHDYVVLYAKSKENWQRNLLARSDEQDSRYKNPDNDPRGDWKPGGLDARNYYGEGTYPITTPSGRVIDGPPKGAYWRVSRARLDELDAENRIWWGEDGGNVPAIKRFLSEVRQGVVPQTIWGYSDVGHTQEAKQEIVRILGDDAEVFATPKPPRLIKRILELATDEQSIVLDSCAGSGTTAQAVLELNAEDGGNRRFLLVQQPYDTKDNEKDGFNICERITAERVRRVVCGYSFQGNEVDTLFEEKVGLNSLKSADGLLARIEAAREDGQARYDQVKAEMKDGVVRVEGINKIEERRPGLGGSFTYARLSADPLFGQFKDLGDRLPAYEELARYIYFTETSRQGQPDAIIPATGRIGEHAGVSYYLLYRPNQEEDWGMDLSFLKVAEADPNKSIVVYCEMLRVHRDDLRRWQAETGKTIRSMIVPYNLK